MKEVVNPLNGLTALEEEVVACLMEAVDAYAELDVQHPEDEREFIQAIHAAQHIIAVRVARRLFPEGWPTYGAEVQDSEDCSCHAQSRRSQGQGQGQVGCCQEEAQGHGCPCRQEEADG